MLLGHLAEDRTEAIKDDAKSMSGGKESKEVSPPGATISSPLPDNGSTSQVVGTKQESRCIEQAATILNEHQKAARMKKMVLDVFEDVACMRGGDGSPFNKNKKLTPIVKPPKLKSTRPPTVKKARRSNMKSPRPSDQLQMKLAWEVDHLKQQQQQLQFQERLQQMKMIRQQQEVNARRAVALLKEESSLLEAERLLRWQQQQLESAHQTTVRLQEQRYLLNVERGYQLRALENNHRAAAFSQLERSPQMHFWGGGSASSTLNSSAIIKDASHLLLRPAPVPGMLPQFPKSMSPAELMLVLRRGRLT
jgi:hypothetical protein